MVLIIEDCLQTALHIQEVLEERGFQSRVAWQKKDVKKALKERRYDLVVFNFNYWTVGGGADTNKLLADFGYPPERRILFTKYRFSMKVDGNDLRQTMQQKMEPIRVDGVKVIDKIQDGSSASLYDAIQALADAVAATITQLQPSA